MQSSYNFWLVAISFVVAALASYTALDLTGRIFRECQASGFEIAIDDFGTGYSSLAYPQRFRVKQWKIDRFFANGLDEHGPEGSAIVAAIIALAHSLEMDVMAESVETESQRGKLKSMMCDEMQGFLLSKPLTTNDSGALLRAGMMAA